MLTRLKLKKARAPVQIEEYLAIHVGQQGYNKVRNQVLDEVRGPAWRQVRNQVVRHLRRLLRESL